jgi:hypothetical protein
MPSGTAEWPLMRLLSRSIIRAPAIDANFGLPWVKKRGATIEARALWETPGRTALGGVKCIRLIGVYTELG